MRALAAAPICATTSVSSSARGAPGAMRDDRRVHEVVHGDRRELRAIELAQQALQAGDRRTARLPGPAPRSRRRYTRRRDRRPAAHAAAPSARRGTPVPSGLPRADERLQLDAVAVVLRAAQIRRGVAARHERQLAGAPVDDRGGAASSTAGRRRRGAPRRRARAIELAELERARRSPAHERVARADGGRGHHRRRDAVAGDVADRDQHARAAVERVRAPRSRRRSASPGSHEPTSVDAADTCAARARAAGRAARSPRARPRARARRARAARCAIRAWTSASPSRVGGSLEERERRGRARAARRPARRRARAARRGSRPARSRARAARANSAASIGCRSSGACSAASVVEQRAARARRATRASSGSGATSSARRAPAAVVQP